MSGSNQEKIKPPDDFVCYITKIQGEFIMPMQERQAATARSLFLSSAMQEGQLTELSRRLGILNGTLHGVNIAKNVEGKAHFLFGNQVGAPAKLSRFMIEAGFLDRVGATAILSGLPRVFQPPSENVSHLKELGVPVTSRKIIDIRTPEGQEELIRASREVEGVRLVMWGGDRGRNAFLAFGTTNLAVVAVASEIMNKLGKKENPNYRPG